MYFCWCKMKQGFSSVTLDRIGAHSSHRLRRSDRLGRFRPLTSIPLSGVIARPQIKRAGRAQTWKSSSPCLGGATCHHSAPAETPPPAEVMILLKVASQVTAKDLHSNRINSYQFPFFLFPHNFSQVKMKWSGLGEIWNHFVQFLILCETRGMCVCFILGVSRAYERLDVNPLRIHEKCRGKYLCHPG